MADAALVLRVRGESDVPEVLDRDERALRAAVKAREKAERDLTRLIEKGDPLRALERRHQRELKQLEDLARRAVLTEERLQEARTSIAERHAAERERIESRSAKASSATFNAVKGNVSSLGSAMGQLAAQSSSMFGVAARGASSMAMSFASGGPIALGLAATTAAVGALIEKLREKKRVAEEAARAAERAAKAEEERQTKERHSLEDQIKSLEKTIQLRRQLLEGFASDELAALEVEEEARRQLAEVDERRTAAVEKLAQAEAQYARVAEPLRRMAGQFWDEELFAERNSELRAAKEHVDAAKGAVDALEAEFAGLEATVGRTVAATGRMRQVLREEERRKPQRRAGVQDGERYGAEVERRRKLIAETDALMEQGLRESRQTIRRFTAEAQKDLASYLEQTDPFAALDAKLVAETTAIERRMEELRALSRDPALREEALAGIDQLQQQMTAIQARYLDKRAQLELKAMEAQNRAANNALREARPPGLDPKEVERWQQLGMDAGAQMIRGLASFLKTHDPLDLLRTALSIGAGVANLFIPGLGGIVSAIGGFFGKGGVPYAFRPPEGRQGLALGPGPTNDAKPAWLHPREVVMPPEVVTDTFGGLPEAMRVAAGGPLPARGGAPVVINVSAWDAKDALRALREATSPATVLRNGLRMNAVEALSMRSWMAGARYT